MEDAVCGAAPAEAALAAASAPCPHLRRLRSAAVDITCVSESRDGRGGDGTTLEDRGGREEAIEDAGMCQLTVNYVLLCRRAAEH